MENTDDIRTTVELYIYDLTKGMAAVMSKILIGRQIDGIWHTSIVAYGREYFFGPVGIQSVRPGSTELLEPLKIERVGETYLPYSAFLEYINGLGTSTFALGTYNLFKHNCNYFTDEVSNFLVGNGIPKYILDLPEEILQTPVGQSLGPIIETLSNSAIAGFTVGHRFVEPRIQREVSPEYQFLNTAIEEARRQLWTQRGSARGILRSDFYYPADYVIRQYLHYIYQQHRAELLHQRRRFSNLTLRS